MPWTQQDREEWFQKQDIKRSYSQEVLNRLDSLKEKFKITQYGALSLNPSRYPLYFLSSTWPLTTKPTVLITGGVHGYETSGVLGAIAFMENEALHYQDYFNFICFPCLSPWSFETINRWNHKAVDPNRSFFQDSPAEECQLFIDAIKRFQIKPMAHFDLHETTDTDNTIFRLALQQRDGVTYPLDPIPDGFYLVASEDKPEPSFQKAIIDSVKAVTHIAEPDAKNQLIGKSIEQPGVINYASRKLNFCVEVTQADYLTVTEVYPDSPRVTPEVCIAAQIAAIRGGLDYLKAQLSKSQN